VSTIPLTYKKRMERVDGMGFRQWLPTVRRWMASDPADQPASTQKFWLIVSLVFMWIVGGLLAAYLALYL
jgi:hypothetical protein